MYIYIYIVNRVSWPTEYLLTCDPYLIRHCWRSRDELIRDVLLWTPTHGRAKAGRPARTYIQQLCEDTGCCPEDLPRAMNDREEWRERVRDICATGAIWWWLWWWLRKYHQVPFLECFVWLEPRSHGPLTNSKPYANEVRSKWSTLCPEQWPLL